MPAGFAKDHGCPVTGADELDASVRRAGQIVGDYSDQHVSTLSSARASHHTSHG
jgi:hypothetical protein